MQLTNPRSTWFAVLSRLGLIASLLGVAQTAPAESPSLFHQVRPILSDRCFGCHGPGTQESDLRLDTFEGATEWAITPGDAEASEVLARIVAADDDEMLMPPHHSEKPRLSAEEVNLMRRWINSGAEYEPHWAFAPIGRPSPPEPARPIDSFLRSRMAPEGLQMRPEADRRTLARRVTLDLTGLPPSPEEVAEFVADDAPRAYERLVDRLLASPHYGEHMARFWLDAARYADTHGLHLDNYREIWPYRDWVVDAFNENKPYDEFLIEQLAGDLLPDPSQEQLIATGFNRCHVTTNEGGSIQQEVYTRNVFERVDAYGTVCLGLTVGCAKCHDHKYDPISQDDYYSLFAFFNSLDGPALDGNRADHAPILSVHTEEQATRLEATRRRLARLDEQLLAPSTSLDAAQADWQDELLRRSAAALADAGDDGDSMLLVGAWRHVGPFNDVVRYLKAEHAKRGPEGKPIDFEETFALRNGERVSWRSRPDWRDGELHTTLPGSPAANYLCRVIRSPNDATVEARLATDDGARVYLNGEAIARKDILGKEKEFKDRLQLPLKAGRNELLVKLANFAGESQFEFELVDRTTAPLDAIRVLAKPRSNWSDEERNLLRVSFRTRFDGDEALARIRARRVDAEREYVQIQGSAPTTLVFRERSEPRAAFVLQRGQYDQPGEEVDRRTPPFLPAMPEDLPRDRLGLAKWTVSEDNPLPARVAMNRLWQQVFGTGLVATAEDFGSQGAPPTHRRLLDWLAAEFVAEGWDIKRTVRRLVMTDAYRQQSAAPAELWRRDPSNRLLARGPRHRLDGETLRDQALAVSGLLVPRVGGPPVKPPQPDGLWHAVAYSGSNTARFVADKGPDKIHRRSLYTFHKRTSPPPQMVVFDGPTRETCTVRRERTNTPLQALLLMNDPQYVEAAKALAERVIAEEPADPDRRAARLFELCTARPPTDDERSELVAATAAEVAYYNEHPEAARALVNVGSAPPVQRDGPAELAAWTITASTVLNLDEVVCKN